VAATFEVGSHGLQPHHRRCLADPILHIETDPELSKILDTGQG
jgi:hypothetical protein